MGFPHLPKITFACAPAVAVRGCRVKNERAMPAVAPVDPRTVEVPRRPGSPPSYREVAAVTGLDDAKLATTQNPIRAAVGGFEVGEDGGGIVVELDAPFAASPGRSNAPPSYEDALRSPAPAETSAGLDHVHSLQGEGGSSVSVCSSSVFFFF